MEALEVHMEHAEPEKRKIFGGPPGLGWTALVDCQSTKEAENAHAKTFQKNQKKESVCF
jgi:hypothetical protein